MEAFTKHLRRQGRTRRYVIERAAVGWEIRVEEDSRVVRHVRYTDWHRVERARSALAAELRSLHDTGWIEEGA